MRYDEHLEATLLVKREAYLAREEGVLRFTNDDSRSTFTKKGGRPVSTGILRSSGHVEFLGTRKTSGKQATANQELALAA